MIEKVASDGSRKRSLPHGIFRATVAGGDSCYGQRQIHIACMIALLQYSRNVGKQL